MGKVKAPGEQLPYKIQSISQVIVKACRVSSVVVHLVDELIVIMGLMVNLLFFCCILCCSH